MIISNHSNIARQGLLVVALVLAASILPMPLLAQDAHELEQERTASKRLKGEHPLIELMRTRNSVLKKELFGVHPRVYVTDNELAELRQRARSSHRELWQRTINQVRALAAEPPPPPAEKRRQQNDVGIAIAEAAFVYKIEGDKKYLDAARKYMDAAVSYDIWGYANNKPNVDLAAGHLLYGLAWGYDLLYHDLTEKERARYREKLIKQARLMAAYFKPKPGKTFAYSQNHTFIPITGLGVAAYALYDETPEAPAWASLTRAIYDRVLATYSEDGYYYEGFEYWIFSTPWLVHYLDAQAHATGEDLYDRPGFRLMHQYVAHSMLPSGNYVFDFGDIFEGPLTRAGKGDDYKRTHPQGHFQTNYNLLYRFAQRFQSGEAQGVAEWLKRFDQVNAEDFWSLVWYDANLKPVAIEKQPTWHYFPDHDVFYWRSDWTEKVTAFAFKCGPPEGHHTAALLQRFPDWRLSSGHAHPDANSFIIFARGEYLTGDTGYAGVPMTEHHNSLLINGKGQAREGAGHDAFAEVPYDRLNRIRISEVKVEKNVVKVTGDASAAYGPELGLKKFVREFVYKPGAGFTIFDDVQTTKPAVLTFLLHADERIEKEGDDRFSIKAGGVKMLIAATIEGPGTKQFQSAIETNWLTAPGPPGAVDKGERQERGEKLLLSTPEPITKARFKIRLWVKE
ncbi:MAG TPA: DUF4962 domain-containing protein [Pyrinomonadaceae bacterium]|jgi:hypothetical protein|nr:DUF4962 domain-containing protein [Pyrinomonadaceae bacterium]